MDNTIEYNLLANIEQKCSILRTSPCLLSLNAISISLVIDVCRATKYYEVLLDQWQECLPLGDAHDVNFSHWGNKIWDLISQVRDAYSLNRVQVNVYEYESEKFISFKEIQQAVGALDDSIEVLQGLHGRDIPIILVCALRELNEVLMEISEFLNSPTEEQITTSFEKWASAYKKHYLRRCQNKYKKWKIQYSARTLRKHLSERMTSDLELFKEHFLNEDEFEQVFDIEERKMDLDGLARFLFTHTDRFGVSHIDGLPMFSKELLFMFTFIETWRMMQADYQPTKKTSERHVHDVVEDSLEHKIKDTLSPIQQYATESWSQHLQSLWHRIFKAFRNEIAKAGPHEKYKEYSKKTLYCIIGHLKSKGVYREDVTNVEYTKILEGSNNGMRKYISNGLIELVPSLKKRIETFVDKELEKTSA